MFPSSFDQSNRVLHPPEGMTTDEVTTLAVFQGNAADGTPVVVSCWKPTMDELKEIIRSGRVWLTVMGQTMPPVEVTGRNPFE